MIPQPLNQVGGKDLREGGKIYLTKGGGEFLSSITVGTESPVRTIPIILHISFAVLHLNSKEIQPRGFDLLLCPASRCWDYFMRTLCLYSVPSFQNRTFCVSQNDGYTILLQLSLTCRLAEA